MIADTNEYGTIAVTNHIAAHDHICMAIVDRKLFSQARSTTALVNHFTLAAANIPIRAKPAVAARMLIPSMMRI